MKNAISNAVSVVLALCALTVTGLVVRRELFAPPPAAAAPQAPRVIPEWRAVAASGSVMGPAGAPVRIVEFSDFQCPFCSRVQATLRELRRRYPEQVAVVYRHFPLEAIHPHAFAAAMASSCAEAQGRFEAYHDALFAAQDSIGARSWERFAVEAGVPDLKGFGECVASERFRGRVERDLAAGRRIGLQGTPSLLVGDRLVYGSITTAGLDSLVQQALRAQPKPAAR